MSSLCLPLRCFSLLSLAPLAQAQEGDPILPYRPSVASPAQLPVAPASNVSPLRRPAPAARQGLRRLA